MSEDRPIKFANFKNTRLIYQNVFKSDSSLRWLIFNAKSNGLDKVISRIGKNIIFDLNKLDEWIANGSNNKLPGKK